MLLHVHVHAVPTFAVCQSVCLSALLSLIYQIWTYFIDVNVPLKDFSVETWLSGGAYKYMGRLGGDFSSYTRPDFIHQLKHHRILRSEFYIFP